eukprot:351462-Chlamydomonas_euryale.AAC.3
MSAFPPSLKVPRCDLLEVKCLNHLLVKPAYLSSICFEVNWLSHLPAPPDKPASKQKGICRVGQLSKQASGACGVEQRNKQTKQVLRRGTKQQTSKQGWGPSVRSHRMEGSCW